MVSVRENIQFLLDLKNNRVDFTENISIELSNFLKKYRLWYTDKEFKKASRWDKIVNFSRPIFSFICMVPVSMYLVWHLTEGALDKSMQKIAYNIIAYLGLLLQFQSFTCRTEASQLFLILNEMSQNNLRKPNHLNYRSRRNIIYLSLWMVPKSFVILVCVPIPILLQTFRTGELYFMNGLPNSPFSVLNFIQAFTYYFIFVYIYWFSMPYITIVFENFFQIVLNYAVLADDLRELRNGKEVIEEVEYSKLRASMIQFNDLDRCLEMANKICNLFFMAFVPGVFVNVGLFLALLFSMESKWELLINCIYPLYLYLFMSYLCLIGQSLINSSDAIRYAIYECNWYDAPMPFRKMVHLFQIRCERPMMVDLKPFFVLNLELLLRIAKTTYVIIAVVRKLSLK